MTLDHPYLPQQSSVALRPRHRWSPRPTPKPGRLEKNSLGEFWALWALGTLWPLRDTPPRTARSDRDSGHLRMVVQGGNPICLGLHPGRGSFRGAVGSHMSCCCVSHDT